jgi:conserved oligomeric Golgi complex subunit 1
MVRYRKKTVRRIAPFACHPSVDRHMTDADLHVLQLLSAHIKLLLDAPEYLWRLIENNKYFSAAWLYLLARVVHHALVRDDDEDDEETWRSRGVDVMACIFYLVHPVWLTHF